jgi:hypothetical protein
MIAGESRNILKFGKFICLGEIRNSLKLVSASLSLTESTNLSLLTLPAERKKIPVNPMLKSHRSKCKVDD